jgi:hypothetical protein
MLTAETACAIVLQDDNKRGTFRKEKTMFTFLVAENCKLTMSREAWSSLFSLYGNQWEWDLGGNAHSPFLALCRRLNGEPFERFFRTLDLAS